MPLNNWGPQDLSAPAQSQLPEVPVAARHGAGGRAVGLGGRCHAGGKVRRHARRGPGGPAGKIAVLPARFWFPARRPAHPAYAARPARSTAPAPPAGPLPDRCGCQGQRAQVAKASRIWVEGKHDAELVEKVWGDDLRVEGIVVEPLHGIDDLSPPSPISVPARAAGWASWWTTLCPAPKNPASPTRPWQCPGAAGNVLIVGHPYVDVWQAIRPKVLGIDAWPAVPRGIDWKTGILTAFGWPHETQLRT